MIPSGKQSQAAKNVISVGFKKLLTELIFCLLDEVTCKEEKMELYLQTERYSGQIIRVLDSGLSGVGSSPDQGMMYSALGQDTLPSLQNSGGPNTMQSPTWPKHHAEPHILIEPMHSFQHNHHG